MRLIRAALRSCLALALPLAASAEAPVASRFRVEAELRPSTVSICGRFAVDARAHYAAEAASADGRFALKAVHVPEGGCDPLPDPLFSNGFENP